MNNQTKPGEPTAADCRLAARVLRYRMRELEAERDSLPWWTKLLRDYPTRSLAWIATQLETDADEIEACGARR